MFTWSAFAATIAKKYQMVSRKHKLPVGKSADLTNSCHVAKVYKLLEESQPPVK